jgi:hypothetical protein
VSPIDVTSSSPSVESFCGSGLVGGRIAGAAAGTVGAGSAGRAIVGVASVTGRASKAGCQLGPKSPGISKRTSDVDANVWMASS